jgi:hypothetical protein
LLFHLILLCIVCNHFAPSLFSLWQPFHVDGQFELIILVDGIDIIVVFEKCLCVMFGFQLGSLHISKDANNIFGSIYQMPIATIQG